jgi:Uma2 family endonuclease
MLPAEVTKHRFTVEEYHKMAEAGIFGEDDRIELIDGEVVEMTPIGPRHAGCVRRLTTLLGRLAGGLEGGPYEVDVQNPMVLGEYGEPQPDLALVRDVPAIRLPIPDDVALIVEVSDTTLAYDRNVKLPLYASTGIPEVWIVHLQNETVEVHASPEDRRYVTARSYGRGKVVRSETVAGLTLPVENILG